MTRILSDIKKKQGDIKSATDILCELQVETFGSMTRREKTEFILEQVALCIEKGDWTSAGILSRKISTRYFARKPKKTPEQLEKERKERDVQIVNVVLYLIHNLVFIKDLPTTTYGSADQAELAMLQFRLIKSL